MILNETYTLSNGVKIPKLGLGTWCIPQEDTANAVRAAIEIGYSSTDSFTIFAILICFIPVSLCYIGNKRRHPLAYR